MPALFIYLSMAVSPNSTCEDFCIWMQATAWLKITASQNVLIEEVKDAAAASGTVTEHVWNEFLRITGLWYQYYTAYIAQTQPVPPIVTEGTYTPTLAAVSNCSGLSVSSVSYFQIGDNVSVDLYVIGTQTTSLLLTEFTLTIPVANSGNWSNVRNARGIGTAYHNTTGSGRALGAIGKTSSQLYRIFWDGLSGSSITFNAIIHLNYNNF